jgi:N-acetylglucosamine-6-phosphate deacetylase
MIFTNARVITAGGIRDDVDVVLEGEKIAELAMRSARSGAIDLGGNYLAPGFVDLHVHGAVGRDTMEASADAFRAICNYHASGGTTSLLLTTATAPMEAIVAVLAAARRSVANTPQLCGVHVEGPFISRERPGAQKSEFIRNPERALLEQLLEFTDVIRRVTLAPELPGAVDALRLLVERGIEVSGGHSDAWDEEARAGFEAGMRHVTHTFNCMSSARRRGGERVAGLLEFALGEPGITCELIADGHHVSPTLMKMLYCAKRADGICLVTDATAGAGLCDGERFTLAGTECVVRDGACFLAESSTLAGSSALMIDLVRTMVRAVGVPLHEAIAMASSNAARAARLATKGRIQPGFDGDLVVLSPELDVLATYVAGEEIYASNREQKLRDVE